MKFDSNKHHRRSIRLKEYDYTRPGGYFVTIVTYRRDLLFGEIAIAEMRLNDFGNIADECWRAINHFPNVVLGAHIIMPNHVHGIIVINENGTAANSSPSVGARQASLLQPHGVKPKSIGANVGSFKSVVTKRIGREHTAAGIWRRNYCEPEIRDDKDWDRIHHYIESNPSLWTEDEANPLKT